MRRILFAAVAALGAGQACAIDLYFLKTVDVTPTSVATGPNYIGSNPSAVAWNGTDLYVAGLNSTGATGSSAIVRVQDALGAATIGNAFGSVSVGDTRGLSGLAISGNRLLASTDFGTGSGDSLRAFNLDGVFQWNIASTDATRRGTAGPAIDPGFGPTTGPAASALAFGSGRRARFALDNGTMVNTFSGGPIINFATASTTWRDHTYDPATGDLYTRESNRVGKAVRTADAAFGTQTVLVANTTASGVIGQNLAFINDLGGDTILFNDRAVTTARPMTDVIKAVDKNGVAQSVNYFGFTPGSGNGYYDFSWDAASRTLAISDFANRTVTIFSTTQPVPEPATLAALGLGAAALLRRRKKA